MKSKCVFSSNKFASGFWKFFPLFYTISLGGLGIAGLIFPTKLTNTTTGEPFPVLAALILIMIGSIFYGVYKLLKNRYIDVEFYEEGVLFPKVSPELISWSQVEKIGLFQFTRPAIHYIKISPNHGPSGWFALYGSTMGFFITFSKLVEFWKKTIKKDS